MVGTFFVTGAALFFGSVLIKRPLDNNENVVGIYNLNYYYDRFLKNQELKILTNL